MRLVEEVRFLQSDLVPYCFRHTYVTDLGNVPGITLANLKRIVGHAIEGVTDRYTHIRADEAFKVLPAHLNSIGGTPVKYDQVKKDEVIRASR